MGGKGEVLRAVIERDVLERMDRLERAALAARRREDEVYRRAGECVGLLRERFVKSNRRRAALNRVVAIERALLLAGPRKVEKLAEELDEIRAGIEAL